MAMISSTHRLPSELWKALAAPWNCVLMVVGELLRGERLHLVHHLAERGAGLQVERDGGGGKLPVVVDGLRSGFGDETGQGIERNQLAGGVFEVQQR